LPEIMPDEAYAGGAAVVATGRSDFPNQVNNVLAFPGIFRGALDARAGQITDEMKLAAAMALAAFVKIPTKERIVPGAFEPGIAEAVAEAVKGAAGRDTKVGGKNGR
jgi:malate dehydrogenase (oxaloacetate-decarboxylating)